MDSTVHLSRLKLWNFRKYGVTTPQLDLRQPALDLRFKPGLNLLVGENDFGKTAILDAIRIVLLTQSREYIKPTVDDFFIPGTAEADRTSVLRIECRFEGFSPEEAGPFLEWLGIENRDETDAYFLRVWLVANRKGNEVDWEVRAGPDDVGMRLEGAARDLLRVTYLKPLRDSDAELSAGRNSRLAQILGSHSVFAGKTEDHDLVKIMEGANREVEDYFRNDADGKLLLDELNAYLTEFLHQRDATTAGITVSLNTLRDILSRLDLHLETVNAGLGSQNILFMAAELLLLKRENFNGLRLALIEEVEAHLHPQAQLRMIDYLQNTNGQFIVTSHSPNLASKVKLDSIILVHEKSAYPMGRDFTQLSTGDYDFLERFLDVTKANLFFAKGVLLVEGDAENILLPVLAEILGRPLHKYGVSIVNVGSTAFLRYSRIYLRKDPAEPPVNIPVAVVTDLDVPEPDPAAPGIGKEALAEKRVASRQEKEKYYTNGRVRAFVSPAWTLEFELASSVLQQETYQAFLEAKAIRNSGAQELTLEKKEEIADVLRDASAAGKDTPRSQVARQLIKDMVQAQVSKAVMAQCLARILWVQDRAVTARGLLKNEVLRYLVQAIEYVTEAVPRDPADQ